MRTRLSIIIREFRNQINQVKAKLDYFELMNGNKGDIPKIEFYKGKIEGINEAIELLEEELK